MSDAPQSDLDGDEADESEASASDEEEYKRATIYLRKSKKKEFKDWFKMLELNLVDGVDSAICGDESTEKRDMHEALVNLAMDHPEEFVERVEKLKE